MTYTFHNRFTIFDERLNIDATTHELADADHERVILLAGAAETMIKDTGDLVLEGSRYADKATALAAARRWRRALTAAFARSHIGADFGPDDRVTPRTVMITEDAAEILRRIGLKPGERVVADEHRLLVVKSEPRPTFLLFQGVGVVRRGLEQFKSNLNEARARSNQDWSPQKALAYRLVSSALGDTNPETQHIQLVTAVEVLLQQQDRPQAVLDALNGLIDEVSQRPADEDGVRQRLLEILHDDLDESIRRAGGDQLSAVLTDTYGGMAVNAFFRQVYKMRSRLLHRKRRRQDPRPTATELGAVHFELWRMVLDFLEVSE
jgi:hypothetical protein